MSVLKFIFLTIFVLFFACEEDLTLKKKSTSSAGQDPANGIGTTAAQIAKNIAKVCTPPKRYQLRNVNTISGKDIVIDPNTVVIYPHEYAGNRLQSFTKIVFSAASKLQVICEGAFANNDIKTLTRPQGLIAIDDTAFVDNRQLNELNLPDSLKFIGRQAFGCSSSEICVQKTSVAPVRIPKSLTSIGEFAFRKAGIEAIIIPETVTAISKEAFGGNYFTSLTIPKSITRISEGAFMFNDIKTLHIQTVTYIGNKAFFANKLEVLDLTNSNVMHIGDSAFGANKIQKLVISDRVKHIERRAFGFNHIEKLTIPGNVAFIGKIAFAGNKIAELIINEGITDIGFGVFAGNPIATLKLPSTLKSIGSQAFMMSTGYRLTRIEVPKSVTFLGTYAFIDHPLSKQSQSTATPIVIISQNLYQKILPGQSGNSNPYFPKKSHFKFHP